MKHWESWNLYKKTLVVAMCVGAALCVYRASVSVAAYVNGVYRDTNLFGATATAIEYDGDPLMPKAMRVDWTKTSTTETTASITLDKPIAGFVFALTMVNDSTSPAATDYNVALKCPLGADLTGTDWDGIDTATVTYTKTTSDVPLLGYGTLYFDTLSTPKAAGSAYIWYK